MTFYEKSPVARNNKTKIFDCNFYVVIPPIFIWFDNDCRSVDKNKAAKNLDMKKTTPEQQTTGNQDAILFNCIGYYYCSDAQLANINIDPAVPSIVGSFVE